MKIRSEQMTVFEEAAIQGFKQRMIRHLQEAFPKHCRILGEARLNNMTDLGWEKAESYGLIGENSIVLFTDLMFLLGSSFDTDPQLQWAAEILSSENLQDESMRTQALYDKAIDYLDRVSGEQNEHIDAAQVRLRDERPDDFAGSEGSTLDNDLLPRLRSIFPQKYEYIGEGCLRKLIQQGVKEAKNYGIKDGRGIAVFICLMYMLGAGFDRNPQFFWAAEILNNQELRDSTVKTDRLYSAGMNYLSLWCAG